VPFEIPVSLAEVAPGDETRCFVCGPESDEVPREELQAYKHRHPRNHDGYVRFYCVRHVPAAPPAPIETSPAVKARRPRVAAEPRRVPGSSRRDSASARLAGTPERVRPVCPNCFMEIPPTGVCGNCGYTLA
jgi:hypothetical protein